MVKNPPSSVEDTGSTPGRGAKIPHATWCSQKNKMVTLPPPPTAKLLSPLHALLSPSSTVLHYCVCFFVLDQLPH